MVYTASISASPKIGKAPTMADLGAICAPKSSANSLWTFREGNRPNWHLRGALCDFQGPDGDRRGAAPREGGSARLSATAVSSIPCYVTYR
eukprot:6300055-Pyramimonas_sp.AAC.1